MDKAPGNLAVDATPRRSEWTIVDGVGVVHIVNFPGRSFIAYRTLCDRTYGSNEIQAGTRTPTCLQCIGQEGR
jgi:hypothetical protein